MIILRVFGYDYSSTFLLHFIFNKDDNEI